MRSRMLRDGVRRLFRLPLRTHSQVEADANDELRAFLAERIDDSWRTAYPETMLAARHSGGSARRSTTRPRHYTTPRPDGSDACARAE